MRAFLDTYYSGEEKEKYGTDSAAPYKRLLSERLSYSSQHNAGSRVGTLCRWPNQAVPDPLDKEVTELTVVDRLVPVFGSRAKAEQFLKTHPPISQSNVLRPNEVTQWIMFDSPRDLIQFRLG